MKFLTKINRNYLIPFTIVLLAVTATGYFILRIIITQGAKERLLLKMYLAERQIKNTGEIPNLHPVIEVQKTESEPRLSPSFKEVTIRNEIEKEDEIFLEYPSKINIGDTWYTVKIRQSLFENEDTLLILALTMSILLLSASIITFISIRSMNRTVWSGFEPNLHEIESYSFRLKKDISLERSGIEEFERLNIAVTVFISRLKSDYLILKEFTENHALKDKNIFNRFVSGNPKSSGLELSFVRQICETHNLEVQYAKNELHCFTVRIKS